MFRDKNLSTVKMIFFLLLLMQGMEGNVMGSEIFHRSFDNPMDANDRNSQLVGISISVFFNSIQNGEELQ